MRQISLRQHLERDMGILVHSDAIRIDECSIGIHGSHAYGVPTLYKLVPCGLR